MHTWWPAYVGLGSNLNGPEGQVREAAGRLARVPDTLLIALSPLYASAPFGKVDQPDFVNAVAGLLTRLDAAALHAALLAIERALGRPEVRERWGPRLIDLDLLSYGRERRSEGALLLPHPGIVERNFVLYPLSDIAPDMDLPGLGRVAELKGRVAPLGLSVLHSHD
jgi:2-amino-4-hydroxy-6-hydroxymethyldihydropteridine diphosphokinase